MNASGGVCLQRNRRGMCMKKGQDTVDSWAMHDYIYNYKLVDIYIVHSYIVMGGVE